MYKFRYIGPVYEFDRCIDIKWTGETYAKTSAKAKSNLSAQYKKQTNRAINTKITLPNEVELL